MPAMTMVQALNSAMDVMLQRDRDVVIFGEDVGFYGGVFRVTDGLQKKHGQERIFGAPITVRAPCGGGIFGGQTHSQSVEAIFTHVCGLKTVIPSNPYDAKGLLISAIEDDDPVVFFEPKRLYNGPFDGHPDRPATSWAQHPQNEVPDGYYTVPLGK